MSHVAVGTEVGEDGRLKAGADTLCLGTPEIVAEFAMERIGTETAWRWEVQREGEVVAAQPAIPWGRERQRTARVLAGGPGGVSPGQYTLLVYADEQVLGTRSFRVLDALPRVFNLRVADVPDPSQKASNGPETKFEPGLRVIYLEYEHEGLSPGLDLSYALYYEGSQSRRARRRGAAPPGAGRRSASNPQAAGRSPPATTRWRWPWRATSKLARSSQLRGRRWRT